jgi:glucose/arabinose dehydrogenase
MQGVGWKALLLGLITLANTHGALRSELVASGFVKPLFAVSPPGDTNRLFILEQHTGRIRIIDLASKTVKSTPFMIVTNLLTGNEQGLLGLAFHPNFASNGFFYINQVSRGGAAGKTEISRYQVGGDPMTTDVADRSTRQLLLTFDQPESNHNGGWMGFGPDGFLYISSGDGGGADDRHGNPGNGQGRNTLLGKILRIDVNVEQGYGIPDGNPYKGADSMRNEIWAFGLRNPWRCSFDRETGELWIADVGQGEREEIDVMPAGTGGLNFGWRVREGLKQNRSYPNEVTVTPATDPIHDYSHSFGLSVTGGYVYRGATVPELRGKYIFGDYSSTRFWTLNREGTNVVVTEVTSELNPSPKQINSLSSFGEDAAGEIYICDHTDGQIYRIASTTPSGISLQAARVEEGLQISFPAAENQEYVLESSESLGPQYSWTTLTNVPAESARTVSLTQPVTGTARYFRVRTP